MRRTPSNSGISRRRFLGTLGVAGSGMAAASLGLPGLSHRLFAAPSRRASTRTLVAIYLRGGADALNIVAPYADPLYEKVRPEISLAAADGDGEKGVVALDERFGLHPALAPLKKHFDRKVFAPIVCVGSPHPTRSHFDAQDFMEYAAPGLRTMKDGWLNRYLAATATQSQAGALRAVAMQKLLPRALRGSAPALAVEEGARSGDVKDVLDAFDDLYGADEKMMGERDESDGAVQVGRETIETLRRLQKILDTKPEGGREVKYPPGGVSAKLSRIAHIIKANAGLEVACFDQGGYDHHINEGADQGALARLLSDLGGGLSAFADDLGDRLADVLVIVMTEFGRTVRENGNRGTDHGHGGCMLVLGGRVNGGRVLGDWKGLDDKNLYEGRDLPATTDFRTVFDEALAGHMGLAVPKDFFPKFTRGKPIRFLA